MDALTIGKAAARTGLVGADAPLPRAAGLVAPRRTEAGYRLYGLRELNQLRSLAELRRRFGVELSDIAFAARLRREPELRAVVETWLAGSDLAGSNGSSASTSGCSPPGTIREGRD